MLKLAGELLEGQLAEHVADLDAHTRNPFEEIITGQYSNVLVNLDISVKTLVADHFYATPYMAARLLTVDRIAVEIKTAAVDKSARLGIYRNGTNMYPGALVLDCGTINCGTTGVKEIVIGQQLSKGLYWLAIVSDGAPQIEQALVVSKFLGVIGSNYSSYYVGWDVSQAYGVLPDPFTTGGSLVQNVNRVPYIVLRPSSLD